jgi:hypothetical protein
LLVSTRRTSVFTTNSELPILIANNVIKNWLFWRNNWRIESPKDIATTTLSHRHIILTLVWNDLDTPGTAPLDQIIQRELTRPTQVTSLLLDQVPH